MADEYKAVSDQVLELGLEHASTVIALHDVQAQLEAHKVAHEVAVADLEAEIDILKAKEAAYLSAIAELEAEIERLGGTVEPPVEPPPVSKRVLESYLVQGGGGFDWVEVMADGSVVCGTDVGAHVRFAPRSWEGQKWNAGTSLRHCASGTIDPTNGELISHGGSPGGGEGVFVLDTLADDWNGPITGSTALKVNSQNSYGDPTSTQPGAWKFGYGNNFEQRSVGRLTWRRANGSLVCGQFGYSGAGGGGVATLINGSKRVIAGTENWACRGVQRVTDATYLVSTWKSEGPSALPSPGGLWLVDVDANTKTLQTTFPDTVEHTDYINGTTVAACRDRGIWRNGADITTNLPRASEWYSIALRPDGAIVAGCMNPKSGSDGKMWSVAALPPGATQWINLTPPPLAKGKYLKTLNSQEPFAAVNQPNTLGNPGATVCDVAWRGQVPICTASGILWGAPTDVMEPAPGSWIIVNKSYDRTPDGYEAVAESDFRCHWRKPGMRWQKIGFAGGNEGGDVSWVGHVLHYQGVDGTRQTFNADTGAVGSTSAPMPPKNKQGAMTDAKRAAILQTIECQQFGSRNGTFAVDADTLIMWAHGGAVSKLT